jgi:hypothetical protein
MGKGGKRKGRKKKFLNWRRRGEWRGEIEKAGRN